MVFDKMVYKRYIKRGRKKFGPYFYESYKENKKVKTRYFGKKYKNKKKGNNTKRIAFVFFLAFIFLFVFYVEGVGEGSNILVSQGKYTENYLIKEEISEGKVLRTYRTIIHTTPQRTEEFEEYDETEYYNVTICEDYSSGYCNKSGTEEKNRTTRKIPELKSFEDVYGFEEVGEGFILNGTHFQKNLTINISFSVENPAGNSMPPTSIAGWQKSFEKSRNKIKYGTQFNLPNVNFKLTMNLKSNKEIIDIGNNLIIGELSYNIDDILSKNITLFNLSRISDFEVEYIFTDWSGMGFAQNDLIDLDPSITLTAGNITTDGDIFYECIDPPTCLSFAYNKNNTATTLTIGTGIADAADERRGYIEFNTSDIPDTATINSVVLNISIDTAALSLNTCSIYDIELQPSTLDDTQNRTIFDDAGNVTVYNVSGEWCLSTYYQAITLSNVTDTDANTTLKNQLTNDWFAVGLTHSGTGSAKINTSESDTDPELIVTYTSSNTIPYLTLESPANNTEIGVEDNNITAILNATLYDDDDNTMTAEFYVSLDINSLGDANESLVFYSDEHNNGTMVNASFNVMPISPVTNSDNLVLLLHFDNRSGYAENGTYIYDFSGNNNNGTAEGGVFWNKTGGKLGGAYEFDGVDDYVDAGNGASLDITGSAITLEAWIYQKSNTTNTYDMDVVMKELPTGGHVLRTGIAKIEFGVTTSDGGKAILGNTEFSLNAWHHIVGVYNGSNLIVYLDGVQDNITTHSGTITSNTANWSIGRSEGTGRYFNGTIDEVAIFNKSLNDSEILDLYRLKAGTYYWQVNVSDGTDTNVSEVRSFTVNDFPTLTINFPENTTYNTNINEINFTASDVIGLSACWYSTDDGATNSSINNCYSNFTGVISVEGSNNWTVWVNDTSNNEQTASIVFVKDTTYPAITIYAPSNITYSEQNISINFTADNYDTLWFYNGTANTTYEGEYLMQNFTDGSHTIIFYANDTANNINDTETITFVIDTTYPAVTIYAPSNVTYTEQNISINFTADNYDTLWFYNETGNTTYSGEYLMQNFTDGSHTITFYANDTANNLNDTETITFVVDTTNPIITIEKPANNSNFNTSIVEFNITSGETLDYCGLSLDEAENVSMELSGDAANFTNESMTDGNHNFTISCNDTAGNMVATDLNFLLVDITYPQVSFQGQTPADSSIRSNADVFVNVSSSDNLGEHSVLVDWNNSLVFWMRFDERNSTGDPIDKSSYGNNGTNSGATYTEAGKLGGGFSFDGVDDLIAVANSASLNFNQSDYAVGFWVKNGDGNEPGTTNQDSIIEKWATDTAGYEISFRIDSSDLIRFRRYDGTNSPAVGAYNISDGNWHFVLGQKRGGNIDLYVDGVLNESISDTATADTTNTAKLTFGRRDDAGTSFLWNGTIDDVMIYNRALTEEEINSTYNANLYIYTNNFTGLSEGSHPFISYAQDLAGNLNNTETRTVTIDTTNPAVTAISPQSSENLASRSVTYQYNVTDSNNILNCSLTLDNNVVAYNSTTINQTTGTNNIAYTTDEGQRNYYANCTDEVNNIGGSSIISFQISINPPAGGESSGGGGSGGGGGGGTTGVSEGIGVDTTTNTQITSVLTDKEFEYGAIKDLKTGDRIAFDVDDMKHYVQVVEIGWQVKVNIMSKLQEATISLGEIKKFDVTEDNYYDILLMLRDINNKKANLMIRRIHEKILESQEKEEEAKKETSITGALVEGEEGKVGKFKKSISYLKEKSLLLLRKIEGNIPRKNLIISGISFSLIIIAVIVILARRRKENYAVRKDL